MAEILWSSAIRLLERVAAQLGQLVEEMVFVGGCATDLLLTDTAAPPVRATQDVDVLTEVATGGEYPFGRYTFRNTEPAEKLFLRQVRISTKCQLIQQFLLFFVARHLGRVEQKFFATIDELIRRLGIYRHRLTNFLRITPR